MAVESLITIVGIKFGSLCGIIIQSEKECDNSRQVF